MTPEIPAAYLEDASGFRGAADRLFLPASEEELAEVLREASRTGTAVSVAGAGTGLTGGRTPQGGWVVSLERFRRLEVHSAHAIAGAGVSLRDLQAAAQAQGRFFPPDPTETLASLGGVVACNASGSRSFRYGAARRWIRRLRVAMASGEVREFSRGEAIDFDVAAIPLPRSRKHSAGYPLAPGMDWIQLFAGSEGTLGVFTEIEVDLLSAPNELFAGVIFFGREQDALAAVDAWREVSGLRMLEYMDAASLALLKPRFDRVPEGAAAALLVEQEAGEEEIDAWLDRIEAQQAEAEGSWFAASARDRERFREFRHALPEAVNEIVRRNGRQKLGSDYAVPVEGNGEMLAIYRSALERDFPGRYVIFGHIGDAHLHVNILPESEDDEARGRALMLEFARQSVRLGGTVSAEHGLGKRKAHLLAVQYAPEHIAAMKAVKQRLDPAWILSPGNLFPK